MVFDLEDHDVEYVIGEQPLTEYDGLTYYGLLQWKYNDMEQ